MANYDKKTFHWYRLSTDFFERDDIAWIEEQENGSVYVLFYLKLCALAVSSNGVLIRRVGSKVIPYTNELLEKKTNTPIHTVMVAMSLFKSVGLIEELENGALYFTNLEDFIGEKGKSAYKKELQRKLKEKLDSGNLSPICPPFCLPDIE